MVCAKYHVRADAIAALVEQLGASPVVLSKSRIEEVIWEVNDSLDGLVSFDEFEKSYMRARVDRTGLEPSELFFIVGFLMFDKERSGRVRACVQVGGCLRGCVYSYVRGWWVGASCAVGRKEDWYLDVTMLAETVIRALVCVCGAVSGLSELIILVHVCVIPWQQIVLDDAMKILCVHLTVLWCLLGEATASVPGPVSTQLVI